MTEPFRLVPITEFTPHGTIKASSTTSSTSYPVRAGIAVPSHKVIPVIFVPGIMGSNLKAVAAAFNDKKEQQAGANESVWSPPNGASDGLWEGRTWNKRMPADRQALLDPANTAVDERGEVTVASDSHPLSNDLARKRGWGSVHSDSYTGILNHLSDKLNRIYNRAPHPAPGEPPGAPLPRSEWARLINAGKEDAAQAAYRLTPAELKKMADYQYPVYAMGYNWLKSNAEAADQLKKLIDRIKKEWAKPWEMDKVIVVTHSMGGLVARYCAKNFAGEDILGIVHGVMPATGAPAAYRRMTCGTEQIPHEDSIHDRTEAETVAKIMGATPARTTAVLANAAGPLELLPNHLYPKGWLVAEFADATGKKPAKSLSLSDGDPYADIYRQRDAWYRLVDPALIDPCKRNGDPKHDPTATDKAWSKYLDVLAKAETFHKDLGNYHFPNSYAFYGNDASYRSYEKISWQASGTEVPAYLPMREARLVDSGGDTRRIHLAQPMAAPQPFYVLGGISLGQGTSDLVDAPFQHALQDLKQQITLRIGQPSGAGDGTVPHPSGSAPTGIRQLFALTGFDHQGSYNNAEVRDMVLYSIGKIVQGAK